MKLRLTLNVFEYSHLLDLLLETLLQVLVTPDQLVKNLIWFKKETSQVSSVL